VDNSLQPDGNGFLPTTKNIFILWMEVTELPALVKGFIPPGEQEKACSSACQTDARGSLQLVVRKGDREKKNRRGGKQKSRSKKKKKNKGHSRIAKRHLGEERTKTDKTRLRKLPVNQGKVGGKPSVLGGGPYGISGKREKSTTRHDLRPIRGPGRVGQKKKRSKSNRPKKRPKGAGGKRPEV